MGRTLDLSILPLINPRLKGKYNFGIPNVIFIYHC